MRPVKERIVILNPDGRLGDYWSAIGNSRWRLRGEKFCLRRLWEGKSLDVSEQHLENRRLLKTDVKFNFWQLSGVKHSEPVTDGRSQEVPSSCPHMFSL